MNLAAQCPLCFPVNPVGVDSALLFTIRGEKRKEKREREREKKRERERGKKERERERGKKEREGGKKKRKKNILKLQCLYILTTVFQEFVCPCCIRSCVPLMHKS